MTTVAPARSWAGRVTPFHLAVGAVIALAVLPKLPFLTHPIGGMDESLLLVFPEQIADGRVPNRDYFTVYGPGNSTLLAALFAVTGPSLLVVRLVGLAYQVAIVAGVMALVRGFGHGRPATVLAGALSALLLIGPNLLASSWMGGLALTVWSLVLLRRGTHGTALWAGVLAGLSLWWRLEFVALQAAALPQLWRRPAWRRYAVGFTLGVVPTLVHLVRAGRETYSNVVVERLGLNAQLAPELLGGDVIALLVALLAAVLFSASLAVTARTRDTVSVALLSVAMLPQALQRVDHHHVIVVACVAVPLAVAWLVGRLRPGYSSRQAGVGAWWGTGGVLLLAGALTAAFVVAAPPSVRVENAGRSVYLGPGAPPLDDVIATVERHVSPGSRVFMGAQDMSVPTGTLILLYHLLPQYSSDFYYLELPPGVAERRGSPLVADIESADALVLVRIDPRTDDLLYPGFGQGVDDANRAVERLFCPVGPGDEVTVYLRRGAGACG